MVMANKVMLKLLVHFIKIIGGFDIKFEEKRNKRNDEICKVCDLKKINLSVDKIVRITKKDLFGERTTSEDSKTEDLLENDLLEYKFSVSPTNIFITQSTKYCIKCFSGIGEDIINLLNSDLMEITIGNHKIFIFHNDGKIKIQELKKYKSMHAVIFYENEYLLGRVDIGDFPRLKVNEILGKRKLKIPIEILNDKGDKNLALKFSGFRFISFKSVKDNDSSFISLITTKEINYLELGFNKETVKLLEEVPQELKDKINLKYNNIGQEKDEQLSSNLLKDTEKEAVEKKSNDKKEFNVTNSLNKQDHMTSILLYALMVFIFLNILIIRYNLYKKIKRFISNTIKKTKQNCIADKEMEL